jgi:hypothetical protein
MNEKQMAEFKYGFKAFMQEIASDSNLHIQYIRQKFQR